MTPLRGQLRQGIIGQDRQSIVACLALVGLTYLTSRGYRALNHGPQVLFLKTPLDDQIPLVPPFVIPYVTLGPFIYLSLLAFLLFRVRIFQSAALAMTTVLLVSYGFFFFLQTYVERPELTGDDVLIRLLREVYTMDNSYNDFPSLHVALSTTMAIHWWRLDRRVGLPLALWTALIVASTVFVKQHYLLDIPAGLALAFGASLFFLRRLAPDQAT
jgi:membrane-associated phospholipid phosphatase